MAKSPDSTAANRVAVSGWTGLKAATRAPVAVPGRHSASSSPLASPLRGSRARGLRRRAVGGMGDLGVAPEVGDAFGHRAPARRLVTPVIRRTEHLELARIVDGRLDPQDVGMIVELDGVGLEAEAHPAAFRALLAVDGDLA